MTMLIDAPEGLYLKGSPFTELALTPDHHFTLTGSQYFGYATADSDWDFLIQDSPEVRTFLTSVGFALIPLKKYEAPLGLAAATNAVWQHSTGGETVQIQLCPNAVLKRRVRDLIMTNPDLLRGHAKASKDLRGWVWMSLHNMLTLDPQSTPTP